MARIHQRPPATRRETFAVIARDRHQFNHVMGDESKRNAAHKPVAVLRVLLGRQPEYAAENFGHATLDFRHD